MRVDLRSIVAGRTTRCRWEPRCRRQPAPHLAVHGLRRDVRGQVERVFEVRGRLGARDRGRQLHGRARRLLRRRENGGHRRLPRQLGPPLHRQRLRRFSDGSLRKRVGRWRNLRGRMLVWDQRRYRRVRLQPRAPRDEGWAGRVRGVQLRIGDMRCRLHVLGSEARALHLLVNRSAIVHQEALAATRSHWVMVSRRTNWILKDPAFRPPNLIILPDI